MRASHIVLSVALLGLAPAGAADLDRADLGGRPQRATSFGGSGSVGGDAYGFRPAPGPYVVAPQAYTLLVPKRTGRPLRYAPPPVYPAPPPLIAAVPIVGPYLVPSAYGPPAATALDSYDHRFDYNQ